MCGIAGSTGKHDENTVRAMMDKIRHRGPDGDGLWGGVPAFLGHRRLSIIDLVTGDQPMQNQDGSMCVVFNGEIYNYRAIRENAYGYPFRTTSDTEAILALASRHDSPARWIPELDGMFVFALAQGDDLILARDPLGIKTLYTAKRNGQLLFASELKAFPADVTDVQEFPAGHWSSVKHGMRTYYTLPRPSVEYRHPWQALRIVKERLEEAVVKRLVADVPVGVFLSGGLDSSLIAAFARKHKEELHTFAVCMEGSPDRAPARQVAAHLGTCHHERLYTLEEAIAALPQVIYHLESFDAALVRSAIPNFFLAKLAREHVKVALSGEGADELFAGYSYLKDMPLAAVDDELREITANLHNTNLLRCDRMSMARPASWRLFRRPAGGLSAGASTPS